MVNQGILAESSGADSSDHTFSLVDSMVDGGKTDVNGGSCEEMVGDEDGERSVASVEDQLRKEMTVYEVFCLQLSLEHSKCTIGFQWIFELIVSWHMGKEQGEGSSYTGVTLRSFTHP